MDQKFTVTLQTFDELSSDEQEYVSDGGCGKECAGYVRIRHRGETLLLESDAIELEDKTFFRDLGWVIPWLMKAYELGWKDAELLDQQVREETESLVIITCRSGSG